MNLIVQKSYSHSASYKMEALEWKVCTFAFTTRLFILVFQFVTNSALPDHDADVFLPPVNKTQFSWLDHVVLAVFGGLRRWDAVYFTHIMEHGYTYENCVAFFPFYPLVVSSIASVIGKLGVLHFSSWILLIAVAVNMALFVLTARALFRLGLLCLGNKDVAFYAAMFFCINPASIFMSAPYSEILYMCLLTHALVQLHTGTRLLACLHIGLSVFTRSNGLIGIGFILHAIGQSFLCHCQLLCSKDISVSVLMYVYAWLKLLFCSVIEAVFYLVLAVSPFFLYQYYIYHKFCMHGNPHEIMPAHLVSYGRSRDYHLVGDEPSPWCYDLLPLSYSYIQKHHWAVGFFAYYELKQLPNFLLAAPVILLSLGSCAYFFSLNRKHFYTLGLWTQTQYSITAPDKKEDITVDDDRDDSNAETAQERSSEGSLAGDCAVEKKKTMKCIIMSQNTVVYVVHIMALIVFGCCFIHIQVLTRFLFSSTPLIYWYCGALFVQSSPEMHKASEWMELKQMKVKLQAKQMYNSYLCDWLLSLFHLHFVIYVRDQWDSLSLICKIIFLYFIIYCIVGTIMFSNFLPWT